MYHSDHDPDDVTVAGVVVRKRKLLPGASVQAHSRQLELPRGWSGRMSGAP